MAEMTLQELIMQAIGEASMCWSNIEGAGVFDSKAAAKIGENLRWRFIDWEFYRKGNGELRYRIDSKGKADFFRMYCYHCGTAVKDAFSCPNYCYGCGRKLNRESLFTQLKELADG